MGKDLSIAVGNLIDVSATRAQFYSAPSVIALQDGGFAVFWAEGRPEEANSVLVCRLFDETGEPRGSMRPISTGSEHVNHSGYRCAVECADTALNVFWEGKLPGSSKRRILATRFDPADGYTTPIVAINTSDLDVWSMMVAPLRDATVVVWHASEIPNITYSGRGRAVNHALMPVSAEFRPYTIGSEVQLAFTIGNAGTGDSAVVAWTATDRVATPQNSYLFAHQFDGRGNAVGNLVEIRGQGYEPFGMFSNKVVTSRKAGGFHAFYLERHVLYGCVFDEDGIPLADKIEIARLVGIGDIRLPDAAPTLHERVAAFWSYQRPDSQGTGILMRMVDSRSGLPIGQETQISPADNLRHEQSSAALLKNGAIAVTWHVDHAAIAAKLVRF